MLRGAEVLLEGIVRVDADTRPHGLNDRARLLLGDVDASLARLPLRALLADQDAPTTGRLHVAGADGRLRWLDYRIAVHWDAAGLTDGATVALLDVTQDRARARALAEANDQFREVFSAATIGMAVLDRYGNVTSANPALAGLIGVDPLDLLGRPFAGLAVDGEVGQLRDGLLAVLADQRDGYVGDVPLRTRAGGQAWTRLDARLLRDADGAPSLALVQVTDTTRQRAHEAELERLADHDALTGLLNRRGLLREIQRQLVEASRYGADGALLIVDLDDFKRVNDALGHEAGDRVLRSVAATLARRVRESDALGRLGGDEFAVVVPHGSAADAEQLAEGLLDTLHTAPPVEGVGVTISASIGVIGIVPGETALELLARADRAMYEAKAAGRDGVVRHEPGAAPPTPGGDRVRMLAQVRDALAHGRLRLLAQPVVDAGTGEPEFHELLLRLAGDDGELVRPAEFLPIAERFDLVQDLDRWVVRQALALVARRRGPRLVSVNLSAASVVGDRLVDSITHAVAETGGDPSRVVLEIRESAGTDDVGDVVRFAERVSALGCRLAIDDFGGGYGSLQYLRHLPFDFIKLHGQFVVAGPASRTDALIVDAVRDLAHGMGKRVVAEYVGDARVFDWAREHRLDLIQGYHTGRPVPVERAFVV